MSLATSLSGSIRTTTLRRAIRSLQQDGESDQEYQDRIYGDALDMIMDAVEEIEEEKDYNFQSYTGTPDVEWYDEAREMALIDIMGYISGTHEEE